MSVHPKNYVPSSFSISLIIHALGLLTLIVYPPTKSFIFTHLHKPSAILVAKPTEKVLDELSIIKIPKKNTLEASSDILSEEIGSASVEENFRPYIDLSHDLSETLCLDLPIDNTQSFIFKDLGSVDHSLMSYLSPLTLPIPSELLSDQEPKTLSFQPKVKPLTEAPTYGSELSQIDELTMPSVTKAMPDMLETELYTYKDNANQSYFKMELKLKEHKLFDEQPQEFLFVIDCTHKGAKTLLPLYKEVILKSIKSLKNTDTFNVIFLNKNIQYLFPVSTQYNPKNHELLEDLLTKKPKIEGRLKDLIKNLASLFDKTEENSLHTHVIVFSDEPQKEKDSLLQLAKYAHSKLSLYPVLYSETPHKPTTFKTLVDQMGGRLLVPPTKASFSRKFTGLILDIKKTRLRNVMIKVESDEGAIDISVSEKTKALTLKKPLKIFGKLSGSKNLKLKVVGSSGDDLFEMKRTLSIPKAKKGSSLIKEEAEAEQ